MNTLTLAVAGSRKTQSIVDACSSGPTGVKRLALTFTITGQAELTARLTKACGPGQSPEVMGWYSFLLRHWIRPYLPMLFSRVRLAGLNFDGEPAAGWYATGRDRYFDAQGRAYKRHLSKLATEVYTKCDAASVDRIQRIYKEIYIDEVQDLTGCDLDLLEALLDSTSKIVIVGDVRQSIYDTNPQDPRHKQYRGLDMVNWFRKQEAASRLVIEHSCSTWRSNQTIATFSDTVLNSAYGFLPTKSLQQEATQHDGVFVIGPDDVASYMELYSPLCLRSARNVAAGIDLPFRNFGEVKGLTCDRVLIYPTAPITKFLTTCATLKPKAACGLYVGVTRARHSVAFVIDKPDATALPRWRPPESFRD
jgi:DNA helicase II / ATP-dependent DNA helicase PcrA